MRNVLKNTVKQLRLQYLRYVFFKRDSKLLPKKLLGKLSHSEINTIQKEWDYCRLRSFDLIYPRIYRYVYGMLPSHFMTDYQLMQLYEYTNPVSKTVGLENKAMCDVWFPSIPFPKTILKQINNVFYSSDMSVLSESQAIDLVQHYGSRYVVIKPSIDSNSGKGVKRLDLVSISSLPAIWGGYNGNFVIQEIVEANREVKELNPESINSCRITSIYINGKFDFATCIKVGKKNCFLDNWRSSYLVGVDKEGALFDFGIDNRMNKKYQSDTGIPFKGFKIPCFEKMAKFVKENHIRLFPHIGIIGWDIFIDSNYDVKVIEVNLSTPGVVGEQLASGTFFTPFWDDICEILKRK